MGSPIFCQLSYTIEQMLLSPPPVMKCIVPPCFHYHSVQGALSIKQGTRQCFPVLWICKQQRQVHCACHKCKDTDVLCNIYQQGKKLSAWLPHIISAVLAPMNVKMMY